MAHSVLIKDQTASKDVSSYNRSVVSGSTATSLDNGNVFLLQTRGTSASNIEAWVFSACNSASMIGLWMAASPEVPITVDGTLIYKGMNQDPRNFYNVGGTVFDAFKPQVGDIITLTADALDSGTAQAYANASAGAFTLVWAAGPAAATTFCLRYLATTYISIGSGGIDNQRVAAFKFEVLYN
jgi:hypothetical protein